MRTVSLYSYDELDTVVESCVFGEDRCDFGDCDGWGDGQIEEAFLLPRQKEIFLPRRQRSSGFTSIPREGNIWMDGTVVVCGCVS